MRSVLCVAVLAFTPAAYATTIDNFAYKYIVTGQSYQLDFSLAAGQKPDT